MFCPAKPSIQCCAILSEALKRLEQMKSSFTRRSFLKTSALAGTALTGLFPVPNILSAPSPGSKLNCAIIGCGGRMMNHLDWLVNTSKDNIVAAVDPDEKQHAKIKSYLDKHEG